MRNRAAALRRAEQLLADLREQLPPRCETGRLRTLLPDLLRWFKSGEDESERIANSDGVWDLIDASGVVGRGGLKFLDKARSDLTLGELEECFDRGATVPMGCGWPMEADTAESWRERVETFERVRQHLEAGRPRPDPELIDWSYR